MAAKHVILVEIGIAPDIATFACSFDRFRPFPRDAEDAYRADMSAVADVEGGDAKALLARLATAEQLACDLFDASCLAVTCDGEQVPLDDVPPSVKSAAVAAIHERWRCAVKAPGQSSGATC